MAGPEVSPHHLAIFCLLDQTIWASLHSWEGKDCEHPKRAVVLQMLTQSPKHHSLAFVTLAQIPTLSHFSCF